MFRSFYDSWVQQPGLLLLLPLASLPFLPRRRSFLSLYLWLFTLGTILDALLTSPFVPWPPGLGGPVAILFVIIGDLRLFVLLERFSVPAASRSWLPRALGASLVVPVLQAGIIGVWPEAFAESRYTFLAYETLFLLWLQLYQRLRWRTVPPAAANTAAANTTPASAVRTWSTGLVQFALAYYCLWALADLWILSPADAGFALRVVPNVLYYGAFLLFAWQTAPREVLDETR